MTTASLPHGHSAPRARRGIQFLFTALLAAASLPALASNPVIPPLELPEANTTLPAASPASLAAIATPDTAPIAEQLQALKAAQDEPST